MLDQDAFTPEEELDEQNRPLLVGLRRIFDTQADDLQSLSRARARMLQKSRDALPVSQPVPMMRSLPASSHSRREGKTDMHFIHAAFYERRSWQRRLTTVVAAFFAVLLVGSLVLIPVLWQQGSGTNLLGRGTTSKIGINAMTLQVSPASIAIGGMITVRGSHFTPNGEVGLTHDGTTPLIDTAGQSMLRADASGAFHDTVVIDNSWTAGPHLIRAEDAHLHKTASFALQATGQGLSQLPPHLLISPQSVDLGSGDQATQAITIWNGGGGQISWQATSTRPWLLLSPASGTFTGAQQMHITLGADRSNLRVGIYQAKVIFTSNAGRISLPVQMKVTP